MKVLLGVSGGIAVYKACELVRRLQQEGDEVRVLMTEAATRFVSPLTFATLSGGPVGTTLFNQDSEQIDHIRWARWAELVLVAPATANTVARFAHGMADDLLSTVVLATESTVPVLVAPAMNTAMWENPLVRRNLDVLREIGRFTIVPPVDKTLACGETGVGGLAEESEIVDAVSGFRSDSH